MRAPLHILASMEALTLTGPARNLLEFARLARAQATPVQLTVLTFRRPTHPTTDPFLEAIREAGAAYEVIIEKGPLDLRVLPRMRELVQRLRPTVLQTHNNKSHFLMRASGLPRSLPWIAFHHGYTIPTRRQQVYNLLDRWSLRAAHRVVTVTSAFLPELQRSGVAPARVTVIPNSIRSDWALPRQPPDPGAPHRILSIGRLSREKAHADLLTAAARLQSQGRACAVTLVGDGHERTSLAELAQRLAVPVHFAGQVQDVRPFLAAADVFALPSLSEGSPNVLLEAMAFGVPVVATAVGGVPETLVDGQEGVLVPAAQPDALANALATLLTHPDRAQQLAQAARSRIAREFAPSVRLERLLALYQGLSE